VGDPGDDCCVGGEALYVVNNQWAAFIDKAMVIECAPGVNVMAMDTFVVGGVCVDLRCVWIIFKEIVHGGIGWGVTVFGFV
jgi:hypothetical protein